MPPWERSERERALQAAAPADLPFGLYLLLSVIVAIAAARVCDCVPPCGAEAEHPRRTLPPALSFVRPLQTGSLFEWSAGNPVFGVLGSDSPLYGPVLGVFVFTGLPLSAYLFSRCVAAANADSERADKLDGL